MGEGEDVEMRDMRDAGEGDQTLGILDAFSDYFGVVYVCTYPI
jgi:hypothetical protein